MVFLSPFQEVFDSIWNPLSLMESSPQNCTQDFFPSAHIQNLLQTKPVLRLDTLNHSLVYFISFQNWLEKSHSWEVDYCDIL